MSETQPAISAPISPIVYLQAPLPLAHDHDLGVPIAELDLSNMAAGAVNLLCDHGCAR
jgi:hypothetical protein